MTIVIPIARIRTDALLSARSRKFAAEKNEGAIIATTISSTANAIAADSSLLNLPSFIFEFYFVPFV
jgi:hypothetical protein